MVQIEKRIKYDGTQARATRMIPRDKLISVGGTSGKRRYPSGDQRSWLPTRQIQLNAHDCSADIRLSPKYYCNPVGHNIKSRLLDSRTLS